MRLVDIDDIRVMKFLSEEDDPSESDGEREYRNGWNDALTAINDIQPSAEPTEASCWGCNCPKMERMLPSAEPELATNLQQSCNQLATDCISRQAVKNVIFDMHIDGEDGVKKALPNTYGADLREIIEQIDALPSAEPFFIKMDRLVKADERERLEKELCRKMERQNLILLEPDMELVYPKRKGKWVRNIHDKIICNQCGMFGNNEWNFCPNCGADMRDDG